MDKLPRALASLGALAAVALAAPAAQAAPDRTVEVSPTTNVLKWTGASAVGLNLSWFVNRSQYPGTCSKDPQTYCETTLVHVTAQDVAPSGRLIFRIENFKPVSDFDIRVYESDAAGGADNKIGSPVGDVAATSPAGSDDPRFTGPGDFETTAIDLSPYVSEETADVDAYFLVMVPYFTVINDTYDGKVTLEATPLPPAP
jgi:hypothetical protein